MAQLLAMVEALRQQNDNLQDIVLDLQQKSIGDESPQDKLLEPQALSQAIWDDQVPEGFKSPSLTTYDGKTDPQEHVIAVNNQMAIIGTTDSLKCKLMADTFNDVAL